MLVWVALALFGYLASFVAGRSPVHCKLVVSGNKRLADFLAAGAPPPYTSLMGSEMSSRARRWACAIAIGASVIAAFTPAASARPRHLDLPAARQAARAAVLSDPTYRIIDSTQPLRTRRCWRSPGRVVHCSLYRFAASPCALDGGPQPGAVCIQVIARRIWLVEVKPANPPAARLLRVVDTTKVGGCRYEADGARLCE
jgi:hypothetical protein